MIRRAKNYWKAYKAYEKKFMEAQKKCDQLAETFANEHKVGVVLHWLLLITVIYTVCIGIYLFTFYGIPWIVNKINSHFEKKKEVGKVSEELKEKIDKSSSITMDELEKACDEKKNKGGQ